MNYERQKTVVVGTWNIAGAELGIDYYADRLRDLSGGIVAIQEAHEHTDPEKSTLSQLAKQLGMVSLVAVRMHQSHIDPEYDIAMGVLCSERLAQEAVVQVHELPQPQMDLAFPDGTPAIMHDRPLVTVTIGKVTVATVHNWPLKPLGYSFEALPGEPGHDYTQTLTREYIKILSRYPHLVVAGDFNIDRNLADYAPSRFMRNLKHQLHLRENAHYQPPSIQDRLYRPDRIIYSETLRCIFLASSPFEQADRRLIYGEFYSDPIAERGLLPSDFVDVDQIVF